ncbi:MAG: hypothetical protein ACRD1X_22280 [Vicinamibacteria bacterium]
MDTTCYGDHFEMYLNDLLRDEGSLGRRQLFEQFVQRAVFDCNRCREEFEMRSVGGVQEDDAVLCPRCRKKT